MSQQSRSLIVTQMSWKLMSHKALYMNVYSSFIHNCHNLEAIEMPFSRWVNKTTVWMQTLESSVQFSRSVVSGSLWPHGLQHARLSCPSPTPGACSDSHPLNRWCHPTILSSVASCLQSFPAPRSFPMSQFFTSGGQSSGASASASVLPMDIQDWFPLGWTGLISLQSKGLSSVFSNTPSSKASILLCSAFFKAIKSIKQK